MSMGRSSVGRVGGFHARRTISCCLAGAFGLAACADSSTPGDTSDSSIPEHGPAPRAIQLEPYFRQLRSVQVTVSGEPRRFLFDTGGGQTIISPELAEDVGCEPYGRSVGFRMSGERVDFELCDAVDLRIGDFGTGPATVAVWDVSAVLPGELPPLDGVISLASFDSELITLDLARGQLIVETEASFETRTATMSRVPMRVATGPSGAGTVVYVRAEAGARSAWLQLDSGNIAGVQLSPDVVELFGVTLTGPRRGSLETRGTVSLDSVRVVVPGLGGTVVRAVVRPLIVDGALSFDFLQRWVFSMDLDRELLWAEPAE